MSRKTSAGIVLYRRRGGRLEVLLAHPGGPYFADRDAGHWTIPKGEPDDDDELLVAAAREFGEETGHALASVAHPGREPMPLGTITQASGKVVHAWAVEGDLDPATASSNTFEITWPPGSGRRQRFPEIDRLAWFDPDEARRRSNPAQAPLIDRLEALLADDAARR